MQTPYRRTKNAADRIAKTEQLLLLDPEKLDELLRFYTQTRAQDWNLNLKLSRLAADLREELWVIEGALAALANRPGLARLGITDKDEQENVTKRIAKLAEDLKGIADELGQKRVEPPSG